MDFKCFFISIQPNAEQSKPAADLDDDEDDDDAMDMEGKVFVQFLP